VTRYLLVLVVLAGCRGGKSKLDLDRGADADALWALAPDGTELGIVATPRAVGLAFRALDAVRDLANHPELAPVKPQIDQLVKGLLGSETGTPAGAGFGTDKPFAMFATASGVLGVMPVGDRVKVMTAKQGQLGSNEDILEGNRCRTIRGMYICASDDAMFERVGKGTLRGKLASAGARGDAELYMATFPLLGAKGELAIAAQLEPGQIDVSGRWSGMPPAMLARAGGLAAPRIDTTGVAGFVAVNVQPLLAGAPAIPIAGGVTLDQLAASLHGPVSAVIPAGSVDIQVHAPLVDPVPATTALARCDELAQFFELAKTQTPGACRFILQGTSSLELDAWVEDMTLRFGAKKGAVTAGKAGAVTRVARELASGDWTAALWGRGTMLNTAGVTPVTGGEVPPQIAIGIHALALVNELGTAVKVEATGVGFRMFVRTAWTNPPEVVKKLVAISGADVLTGTAGEPAKAIAAAAPGTPFAVDFAAGQGGLMVPGAAIGLVSAVAIPAVMRLLGRGGEEPPDREPDPARLADLLVRAYADEALPKWHADHPETWCPPSLAELATYFGDAAGVPVLVDPWGNKLQFVCNKGVFVVRSLGPDGVVDTDDDIEARHSAALP
jgi:hypothetical protein